MNTVKEFKEAGLVFEGEDIVSANDNCNVTVKNAWLSLIGHATVKSFAWRTNTGVKPEFNGRIELKLRSGALKISSDILADGGVVDWDLDGGMSDIIGWRPHLAQLKQTVFDVDAHVSDASKVKPVFTQAMADAKELPPVGSDFSHCGELVLCISTTTHDGGVVTFKRTSNNEKPEIACCWNNKSWVQPIDTRTDKEKAVDEMRRSAYKAMNEDGDVDIGLIFELLHDAGYKK
jgi:hypothetical protein